MTSGDFFEAREVPRRRGRGLGCLIAFVIVIVILAVAAFAVDQLGRGFAQQQAADRIGADLPAGSGTPTVDIRGGSFLLQLASGRFDDVRVVLPGLAADGQKVDVALRLSGVPANASGTVDSATGTVSIGADALAALAKSAGVTGTIGVDGQALTYADEVRVPVLGTSLPITATLVPSIAGQYLDLAVTDVKLQAGSANLDVTRLAEGLQQTQRRICGAALIPKAATLTGVRVGDGALQLSLKATDLPLSAAGLSSRGTCS